MDDTYWKDFAFREIAWWEERYEEHLKKGDTNFCEYLLYDERSNFVQMRKFLYERFLIEYIPFALRKRSERECLKQLEFEF